MVFNSIEFLIFFPAVLLLYFVLPQKLRIGKRCDRLRLDTQNFLQLL